MADIVVRPLASSQAIEVSSEWTFKHALLMKSVFKVFEAESIKYIVIRNDEELPDNNTAKDVDILIDPRSQQRARRLVLDTFTAFGINRLVEHRFGNVRCLYGIDYSNSFSIHIDLIAGYAPKGFSPLAFSEIYKYRRRTRGFWALNPQFAAVFLLVYKIFGYTKPVFKDKYINELKLAQSSAPNDFDRILCSLFGESLGASITDAIKNESSSQLIRLKWSIDWKLKIRSLQLFPFYTLVMPIFAFLQRFVILLRKVHQSKTSISLIDLSFSEVGGIKDELRAQLGKTFVRDGSEFVEFIDWGATDVPYKGDVPLCSRIALSIRRPIRAARLDKVSIYLLNPQSFDDQIFNERRLIRPPVSFELFLPKYLICFGKTQVGYFKKSWGPVWPRYHLLSCERLQVGQGSSQTSRCVVKFLLDRISTSVIGSQK